MKIEELKQLADRPIGDLPLNNWSALCQQLGQMGLEIHDLIPFLNDSDRLWELVCCLKSKGYSLTKLEKEVASVLGWHNVLVAPMVYDALQLYCDVSDQKSDDLKGKREFQTDSMILWDTLKCYRARNKSDGAGRVSSRAYKLVYNTSLSLDRTLCDRFGKPQYKITRYLNKHLPPSNKYPRSESWWEASSESGYFVMDFAPWFSVPCTADGWRLQDQDIAEEQFHRISLPNYVQTLIAHWKIQFKPTVADSAQNGEFVWVINSPELQVFVREGVLSPDDPKCMEIVTFEGEGVGRESGVMSGRKLTHIAGEKI